MTNSKKVLITGTGRAMAIQASRLGYEVILAGCSAATLAETQLACGNAARQVVADVTTPEARSAIRDALGGPLDVLINNAGTLSVGHLRDMGDNDLERMVAINLVAPMARTCDLLPALGHAKVRVVNIGSVFGDIGYPFFVGYSATKFGLRGFSDAIRRELSGAGIGETYIAPRAARTAAEGAFNALIEPMDMTLDSADTVASQAWDAILKGKRENFPKGKERFFVKTQRLFSSLVDRSVGAQARDPRTLAALDAPAKN